MGLANTTNKHTSFFFCKSAICSCRRTFLSLITAKRLNLISSAEYLCVRACVRVHVSVCTWHA